MLPAANRRSSMILASGMVLASLGACVYLVLATKRFSLGGKMSSSLVIRFLAPVSRQSIQKLISYFDNAPESGVTLLLATNGGETDAGINAFNFIKAASVPVTTVNMGCVASIGSALFCAGDKRLSMPIARFGFHPNTFTITNRTVGVPQLEEMANQLKVEHEAIAGILSAATGKSKGEARKLILEHQSLSAEDAHQFGLVHEVREFSIPKDAKVVAVEA